MKNKLILLITTLSFSLSSFAINNKLKKETFLYFDIDIRSMTEHPIMMNGVVKKLDYSELNLSNGESFLLSFYNQGYFVPNLLSYDDVIKESVRVTNDYTLLEYLGQGQMLMNLIVGEGREIKLILDNGENVFIRITEVSGVFLNCSKDEICLPSFSYEYPIENIEEIVNVYIPIDIVNYTKPSRKCVKNMFRQ